MAWINWPTRGLAVVMDLLPLPLHLQLTAMHSALQHPGIVDMSWPGHSSTKRHNISHRAYWSGLLHRSDVPSANDYLRAVNPLSGFRLIRDSFSGLAKFRQPSQLTIYTDGSKTNDRFGTG